MAGGSAPRYAPSDPSLPPQWKALVDGNTGYIYYWNTETNVTQYEKPLLTAVGNVIPPGPPPDPPISAGPPKLAPLPAAATTTAAIASPFRLSESKRSSSSGKNGTTGTSTATLPSRSNNPPEEGLMRSPRHASASEKRPFLDNNDRRNSQSERRYQENDRNRYPPSAASSDAERHHPSSSFSLPERRHPSVSTQPDHYREDISGHHRTSHPHMPDTRARPNEAYGRSLPDHHGRHMQDHHRAPPGGSNLPRSRHFMSDSVPRAPPHSIPRESMHENSIENSWGDSGHSGHAHDRHVDPGRSTSSSRNDRDGRGNVGSLNKLPPLLPALQGQQNGMRGGLYDQDRPVGSSHVDGPARPPLKRSASEYPTGEADVRKRSRIRDPYIPMDIQTYRMHHEITVVGDNVPPPFVTFDSGEFPPELHRELRSAGFTAPTPIQAQAWPIALQNRDLVAIAKTGSGKTLGYLLPAFLHLLRTRETSRAGPIVLVLAPTRELATQIQDEALKFGRSLRISTVCVYGGAPKGPQLRELESGAHIVIATPGRLNDFLDVKKISLRQVTYLVLDEADRMLDMGFEPQIRKIVNEVPGSRQTLMFTATWPREVRKIAADLLFDPVQVNIGNSDELTANKAITQCVEIVQPHEKHRRLEQILKSQDPGSKVIIFCATKKMCDQLAQKLQSFQAVSIHGDKSQTERDYILAQFRSGKSPILVATDVAARGLDVKDIRIVVNYDFPTGVEDYVHRIGRTGRAGATGVAFTFFSEHDSKHATELVKILEGAEQRVPAELRQLCERLAQSMDRGAWKTDLLDNRDLGHRPIGLGSRDGSMRVGPRDEGLLYDGSEHLNYPDEARGRDMGRIGSVGVRVAGFMGREGRISSRVEELGSRGSSGNRDGMMTMRDRELQGVVGTRMSTMSGTRGQSFRSSDGGHRDSWGEHHGWDAERVGDFRDAGFRSSEGRHKDGWAKERPGDDGWHASVDHGTRVGRPPNHRGGLRSLETTRKDEQGEHPHLQGWGVDKRGRTREGAHRTGWDEPPHDDGWGEHPHDDRWGERSHDDRWGVDTRIGAGAGFRSADAVQRDGRGHDDGWGGGSRGGAREEGMHRIRPDARSHDDAWGTNNRMGRTSDIRDGAFKRRGDWEDGWGASTIGGGLSDAKERGMKNAGMKVEREQHPREGRWIAAARDRGTLDTRGGGFKSLEGRHKDGPGEHPHLEEWGGSIRVNQGRERDFRSLKHGHKDGQSERSHDGWGASPRIGGIRERMLKWEKGGNRDGQSEHVHDGWGRSPRVGGSRAGAFKSSGEETRDDGWGAYSSDGDGWGIAGISDSLGGSGIRISHLQGDGRHGGRSSSGGRMPRGPSGGRQSERGRIFDRLGDRRDHRMHRGGEFFIKSSIVAKDGSRSPSAGHSPDKGGHEGHSRSRSGSPPCRADDTKRSLSGQNQTSSPQSSRSITASTEPSMKLADQEDQCGVKDDTDERHRSENQNTSAESQDSKEQPIENSVVEPHEGGADKVPSSGQKLGCEQDATTTENGDECVISVNTAKSSNGIALQQDLPDNDVDRDATTVEQIIMAKETGEVQVSAHKNHVVMRDSFASEQITDFPIVDDTLIAEDTTIKGNNNISENADVTPGGATKGVGRVVSSPEDGIIES